MLQSDDDKQAADKLMAHFQTLPSPIDLYFREDIKNSDDKDCCYNKSDDGDEWRKFLSIIVSTITTSMLFL